MLLPLFFFVTISLYCKVADVVAIICGRWKTIICLYVMLADVIAMVVDGTTTQGEFLFGSTCINREYGKKQWKLFTRQMIRTCQLLPSLLWKLSAPTQLLSGLEAELNNLKSIHMPYQPLIQAATKHLQKEPSFHGIPVSSKCMRRSLLLFLGDTLIWLTGTAKIKDVKAIKTRINLEKSHLFEGSTSSSPCNRANRRPLFTSY